MVEDSVSLEDEFYKKLLLEKVKKLENVFFDRYEFVLIL